MKNSIKHIFQLSFVLFVFAIFSGPVAARSVLPIPDNPNYLFPGDYLLRGDQVNSPNGLYSLRLQVDGRLVLVDSAGNLLWQAKGAAGAATTGEAFGFLTLSASHTGFSDQLALFANSSMQQTSWVSHSSPAFISRQVYLHVQNDSNLVVYNVVQKWYAPTGPVGTGGPAIFFQAGAVINKGQSFSLANGTKVLTLQNDGNLVVYVNGAVKWSTSTAGKNVEYAIMQADGNFVLYNQSNVAVWSTRTSGKDAYLAFEETGALAVYAAEGVAWKRF